MRRRAGGENEKGKREGRERRAVKGKETPSLSFSVKKSHF